MRKMDKRIKKVTDIKTPFSEDFEELSNYIGFNAYGTDDVNCFNDLDSCYFGALKHVDDDANYSFVIDSGRPGGTMPFRYMILEKDLESKEKKYRPYTLMEFQEQFHIGCLITFRRKSASTSQKCLILLGYEFTEIEHETTEIIIIGRDRYDLQELFERYEYQLSYTDGFKPFGVEVEE